MRCMDVFKCAICLFNIVCNVWIKKITDKGCLVGCVLVVALDMRYAALFYIIFRFCVWCHGDVVCALNMCLVWVIAPNRIDAPCTSCLCFHKDIALYGYFCFSCYVIAFIYKFKGDNFVIVIPFLFVIMPRLSTLLSV